MTSFLLYYGVFTVVSLYALWVGFIAIMHLKKVNEAKLLKGITYSLAVPLLLFGLVLDTVVNWTIMSVILLEFPREFLVTQRLKRYYKDRTWRGKFARWFSRTLLDLFDPSGNHID